MKKSGVVSVKLNMDVFYKYGIYFVFLFIVLMLSAATPKFYAPENIINIFMQSLTTGIAAVGVSFVLMMGGIDLSIGSNMVFSGVVAAMAFNNGFGLFLTLLFTIVCGAAIGAVNGFAIARLKVIPFIVTLAMSSIVRGMSLVLNKTQVIYLTANPGEFLFKDRIMGVPVIVIIFLLFAAGGQFIFSKTAYGRQLFACGDNMQAAEKIGITVNRISFVAYLISGIFGSISGFVAVIQISAVAPEMGLGKEFIVKSAAILGGMSLFGGKGSILPGAILGVLIVAIIENGLVLMGANPYAYTVVRGIVIFFAVMIDCVRNKNKLG